MKTMQQTLIELDAKRLLNVYYYHHPIEYETPTYRGMTVEEIKRKNDDALLRYIDRLRNLTIKNDGKHKGILFVHCCIPDEFSTEDNAVCLVHDNEVLEKGLEAQCYCYEFTEQAEIMGFLVADNEYTFKHVYDLMADVLFEASFFGYEQEHLDDEKRALEKSIEEAHSGKTIPFEELEEELKSKYGLEFYKETQEEKNLRNKAYSSILDYNNHFRNKELAMIIDQLKAHMSRSKYNRSIR